MNPLKPEAIKLRKAGDSYKMIATKLGLSKSTLNGWLSRIPFTPNEELIKRVGLAKLKSALHKHKIKTDSIKRANEEGKKDIGRLSDRDLFMLGIGLYLGEGGKAFESIRLSNSDPEIIKLAIKWFYRNCGIKRKNIRLRIHLYPDNNIKDALVFWSKETRIPLSQFGKTMIDIRKDKLKQNVKKLPHGTIHLSIVSNGVPAHGIYLHRRIMAWIDNSLKQARI